MKTAETYATVKLLKTMVLDETRYQAGQIVQVPQELVTPMQKYEQALPAPATRTAPLITAEAIATAKVFRLIGVRDTAPDSASTTTTTTTTAQEKTRAFHAMVKRLRNCVRDLNSK